ncbi:MAG: hypothetical protein V7761_10095 [Amylibacter sp.]
MFSITNEDMEFAGVMALLVVTILAPIIGFISTLLFGYFDPRRRAKPTWAQKRNWVLIAACIVLTVSVATYELYAAYLPGSGNRKLTIGHLFFSFCFLVITKELLGLMSGHDVDKRVMFTLGVNTVCLGLILMFVN